MTSTAKLYGLVLSGGKSTRMGTDKGLIAYHGEPQRDYLYKLLDEVCDKTFMSIREEQQQEFSADINIIVDENEFRGPYNGLLSAHKKHPEVAWLVLACDLPLLDKNGLQELIFQRNTNSLATAYALKENPLPEPLCAIWEPQALVNSISYLEQGNGSCPRKFLIKNEVALVFPSDESILLNANSEDEYKNALEKLK